MTSSNYDIYISADVDRLKRDYAELWALYEGVVHENAKLNAKLDKLRRDAAYVEKDYTWLTD